MLKIKLDIKVVLFIFFISTGLYAQKNQIKEAQSLYDKGRIQEALIVLKKIEYRIVNASLEEKSDFYFLKGNIYKELASKNIDVVENFTLASAAYQDVLLYEKDAREYKYAFKANMALKAMKSNLVEGAIVDYLEQNYKKSEEKSYKLYLYDKKDTLNLFNAAVAAFAAKDYASAINYYEELKTIKYSGKAVIYYATNKKTKKEDSFVSKGARDSSIKIGVYENPRNDFPKPKNIEIINTLAYCYLETKNFYKAEIYYKDVLILDPNCMDCYINLTYTKLQLKRLLIDKMDMLGNSTSEIQEYERLNAEKIKIEKSTLPYLKKALTIEPKNKEIIHYLLIIYKSLDMTNEYNILNTKI